MHDPLMRRKPGRLHTDRASGRNWPSIAVLICAPCFPAVPAPAREAPSAQQASQPEADRPGPALLPQHSRLGPARCDSKNWPPPGRDQCVGRVDWPRGSCRQSGPRRSTTRSISTSCRGTNVRPDQHHRQPHRHQVVRLAPAIADLTAGLHQRPRSPRTATRRAWRDGRHRRLERVTSASVGHVGYVCAFYILHGLRDARGTPPVFLLPSVAGTRWGARAGDPVPGNNVMNVTGQTRTPTAPNRAIDNG